MLFDLPSPWLPEAHHNLCSMFEVHVVSSAITVTTWGTPQPVLHVWSACCFICHHRDCLRHTTTCAPRLKWCCFIYHHRDYLRHTTTCAPRLKCMLFHLPSPWLPEAHHNLCSTFEVHVVSSAITVTTWGTPQPVLHVWSACCFICHQREDWGSLWIAAAISLARHAQPSLSPSRSACHQMCTCLFVF